MSSELLQQLEALGATHLAKRLEEWMEGRISSKELLAELKRYRKRKELMERCSRGDLEACRRLKEAIRLPSNAFARSASKKLLKWIEQRVKELGTDMTVTSPSGNTVYVDRETALLAGLSALRSFIRPAGHGWVHRGAGRVPAPRLLALGQRSFARRTTGVPLRA